MMKSIPIRLRPPLLACLGLLVLFAVQIAFLVRSEQDPVPAGKQSVVHAEAETGKGNKEEWPAILERPLFAPSRRPARKTAKISPSVLDGYLVQGIGVMGQSVTALIHSPKGKSIRMLPGQSLEGWTLSAIEPERLVFEREGEKRVIAFDAKRARNSSDKTGAKRR